MLIPQQITNVENTLRHSLRSKFQGYNPEPAVMPFHTRLLGKDRMALFSFIHSLNTNFGTSIFEPVAKSLAGTRFKTSLSQATAGTRISEKAQRVIQDIMDNLSVNGNPNKADEIEAIREVCQEGEMRTVESRHRWNMPFPPAQSEPMRCSLPAPGRYPCWTGTTSLPPPYPPPLS